jgi:branched-chain amino acid transport system permease protein
VHELVTFTVIGVFSGAAYAVAASGLVVTYSTSGIFNIAHGAIGMFMAFVYWQLVVPWHVPQPLALIVVVLGAAPALGATIELAFIRRTRDNSLAVTLGVTVALLALLVGAALYLWSQQTAIAPVFFKGHGFDLLGVNVTWHQAITVLVAIGLAGFLRVFLYRTRTGIAMRAVVDNRDLVALNGGRPAWLGTFSWAFGSSLAALAGILIAPQLQLNVFNLTLLVLNAYAAAMYGRLRNLPATFAASLGLGLLTSYAVGYLPTGGFWGSTPIQGLRLSIPVIALFAVLLMLPSDTIEHGRLLARRAATTVPSLRRSAVGGCLLVVGTAAAVYAVPSGELFDLGLGLAMALILLSLVPLTGWGGQVSLCQMTFAGLGAFAMYKVGQGGSVWGLVAALALAGCVGAIIGIFTLRFRSLYLALATMAFAVAMDNMFFPAPSVFTFDGSVHIPRPTLFGLNVNGEHAFIVFLAVVFALLSIGLLALRRGPFGRVLASMKDSQAACATLGLNLTTTKLAVFALSAALAGLGGALYGGMQTIAGSLNFQMEQSLPVLLLVVVYGVTTTSGALFGGLSLGIIRIFASRYPSLANNLEYLTTGLAAITLGSYPDGVVPGVAAKMRALLLARAAGPTFEGSAAPAEEEVISARGFRAALETDGAPEARPTVSLRNTEPSAALAASER